MDCRAREDGWRRLDLRLLTALILILMTVVSCFAGADLIAAMIGLVAAVWVGLAIRCQRRLQACQQMQIKALEEALHAQRVIDPGTGATLEQWFLQALDIECRRAVREFTPLTLMQFHLQADEAALLEDARARLAAMLNEQISRPGDLLGLTEHGELQLLLPCTNEHAEHLAQRCVKQAQGLFDTQVGVRLAACTLQPKADLNPAKVRRQLVEVLDEVSHKGPGSYSFRVESAEMDLLNQSFTL